MRWDWQTGFVFLCLLLWSVEDMRSQRILLGPVLAVIAGGIAGRIGSGSLLMWDTLAGAAAGILFWGFSCLTGERMGKGDALVILCLGLYLGFRVTLAVLLFALLLSSCAALYLLLVKKKAAQTAIPFIPFLTGGLICLMAVR
ncbi:MAG: hypothetical protein HFI38_06935 [Lachnospiraceae bacterium]|jgi:leader peptidase (prepilin peptidase)/N-methyltransferase|nr:hypothetical protein [Lachnospiraceae bacterium]